MIRPGEWPVWAQVVVALLFWLVVMFAAAFAVMLLGTVRV